MALTLSASTFQRGTAFQVAILGAADRSRVVAFSSDGESLTTRPLFILGDDRHNFQVGWLLTGTYRATGTPTISLVEYPFNSTAGTTSAVAATVQAGAVTPTVALATFPYTGMGPFYAYVQDAPSATVAVNAFSSDGISVRAYPAFFAGTNRTTVGYVLMGVLRFGGSPTINVLMRDRQGTNTSAIGLSLGGGGGAATAPAAPTIAVTASNAQNSITWTDGSNGGSAITARKLYRSTSSGFTPGPGNLIVTSPTFPYADTGLTNGTTYYYKGIATNAIGDSAASTEQSGAPTAGAAAVNSRAPSPSDDFTQGYFGDGSIGYLEVTTAGVGTAVPTLTIAPPASGGRQATGHMVLTGAGIALAVVDDPGQGYTSSPSVTLSGGTYSTAPIIRAHVSPMGASWIYNGQVWRCTDSASGAAVWALQTTPSAYPLDSIVGLLALTPAYYGTKRGTASYSSTGPCCDITRDSDGTTQTVNFAGDSIDVTAGQTFTAGTVGRVTRWYDHTGQGNHSTQATAANAPILDFNWLTGGLPTLYDGLLNLPSSVSLSSQGAALYILARNPGIVRNRALLKAGTVQIGYLNMMYGVSSNGAKGINVRYDGPVNAELIGGNIASATDATAMLGETEVQCASGCAGAVSTGTGGTIGSATPAAGCGALSMAAVIGRGLTSAERFIFKASVNLQYGVVPQIRDTVILAGDSRPSGSGATNLYGPGPQTLALLSSPIRLVNASTGGSTTADLIADFWTKTGFVASRPHAKLAALAWSGVNDSNQSLTGPQSYANIASFASLVHSTGGKVVISTDPLISTKTVFNPMVVANAGNTGDTASIADAVADYAGNSPPAPAATPHYSLAQYAFFAGQNAARLNPLLAASATAPSTAVVGKAASTAAPSLPDVVLSNQSPIAGVAWSATFTAQTGSSVATPTSDDGTVLTLSGTSPNYTVSGTFPTANAMPIVRVVETNAAFGNSPHATDILLSVQAATGPLVNTTLPALTPATGVTVGTVLSIASMGVFSGGTAPYTYVTRWYKGTNPISAGNGGTAPTYTVVSGDVGSKIRLSVTATDSATPTPASVQAYSPYTNTVA